MSHQPWLFTADTIVEGWRILKPLGYGGMGEVYAVEETSTGLLFAMKINRARDDHHWREQFYQAAASLINLAHPNICKILRLGSLTLDGETFDYVLMSLVAIPGENRKTFVEAPLRILDTVAPRSSTAFLSFSLADWCDLRCNLSDTLLERCYQDGMAALSYLHDNQIVHGDIKPANCLLAPGGHLVFVDFGLANLSTSARHGKLAGTPLYLAPELLYGAPISPASDLYAFGVTLFQVKTGIPYADTPACKLLIEQFSPLWRARLQALLQRDPAQRHWLSRQNTPRIKCLPWAIGLSALVACIICGIAIWYFTRPVIVKGELTCEKPNTVRWEPTLNTELPPLQLAHGAEVLFPLRGLKWRLGKAIMEPLTTLVLDGAGELEIPPHQDTLLAGTLRVKKPATLTLSNPLKAPLPEILLEKGATCIFTHRTNRHTTQHFRRLDASKGGTIRAYGHRFYFDSGCDTPIVLGNKATFEADIVLKWAHVRAENGIGILRGIIYPWGTTHFSAAEDSELRIEAACFMYDYWKGPPLVIPQSSKGTVVFASDKCYPLCAVIIESGRLCLERDVSQSLDSNWCQRKVCESWQLHKDAILCGDAALTFAGKGTLNVNAGAIIEGGIRGTGKLTLSRATLQSGAILRIPKKASLHIGEITAAGVIEVDCATTQGSRPLLTWDSCSETAHFQAVNLPHGAVLTRQANALTLTFIETTP